MEVRNALKNQHHAALAMLRDTIVVCPEDLWVEGDQPRSFWRIVFHTLFYTHLYLHQTEADFTRWPKHRDENQNVFAKPWKPGEGPTPYTRQEMLEYLDEIDAFVDNAIDTMDLDTASPGFSWYSIPKFEHQLVNLRHINQHVGQLSELLQARGIDSKWVGKASPGHY